MFNEICKEMLMEANYMEALEFLAQMFDGCETFDEIEETYEEIDSTLWDLALTCDFDEEDATGNALRLISAIRVGADALEEECSDWED